MVNPLKLLAAAGRHGPALLCGGALIGLVAPPLAELARPLMGLAVFVFTLGAFLKVDGTAFRAEAADRRTILLVLAWATFGVPLVTYGLVQVFRPGPELSQGLLLCALAPPVGSAAAIAAMLGLSAPLALLATVVATPATPLYLPPLAASLAGAEVAIDPAALSARLALIIGGAAATAWLLRRHAGGWVAANPHAMTGLSVLGLIVAAIGSMRGMQGHILAAPAEALALLGLAFLANAGFQVIGGVLFAGLERTRALTVGLVSGNRNITLVWAAAAPALAEHPGVELFLAMSVFPIFILPLVTRRLLAAVDWARAPATPPVPMRVPR
jgi:BASS family bile acid:Na+ symporter